MSLKGTKYPPLPAHLPKSVLRVNRWQITSKRVLLTDALLVGSKEIGLDVNDDKSKDMVVFRDQNAGRSHNIKSDKSSFERVE